MTNTNPLLEKIPHRPPFRFVDEVIEVDDQRIVTTYQADETADFFQGHYPGNPIMPGVLICEACFQSGALLMAHRHRSDDATPAVPVLTRIQDARFKNIIKPGQRLDIDVTLDEQLDNAAYMTARVTSEGKSVLRVSFCCMFAEGRKE